MHSSSKAVYEEQQLVAQLAHALQTIISTPPRVISSPRTRPKRAAIAIVLRVVPPPSFQLSSANPHPPHPTLSEFFQLDWVTSPESTAEILFIQREKAAPGHVDAHPRGRTNEVAFPGGRTEESDEDGLYTAMRQTWEEIGIDLAEKDYLYIGQLDDREITTSLGKRLLMILSPFVFLQITPQSIKPDPSDGTIIHWTSLSTLANSRPQWSHVTVDVASRLAPKNSSLLRVLIRTLIGSMQFSAIVLNRGSARQEKKSSQSSDLKLWGLTLGIVLDLLAYMSASPAPLISDLDEMLPRRASPSMRSVFPRFSYPDVNFWIWVFGKRYREVVRSWETSLHAGGSNSRRINWMGTALNAFYAAVRKALVLVIILRAIGIVIGAGFLTWWMLLRVRGEAL